MKKPMIVTISLAALSMIAATSRVSGDRLPQFGDPVPGLTAAQQEEFEEGAEEFAEAETVNEGLGPVFNGRSCGECHSGPALGGGNGLVETRFGTTTNGVFDPLSQFGGSLIQFNAIGPADGSPHQFIAETVPASATIVAGRRTTPLFGLGYVDAVPDQTFFDLAQKEAQRHDGTAGRVAVVTNVATGLQAVGKFGWKNQVPSLFVFSGDAYLNEMGITNPLFPNENCPGGDCAELAHNPAPGLNDAGDGLVAFSDFMTMLGAPPRGPVSGDALAGEQVFGKIGCAACHTPTLRTGDSEIAALSNQTFHPYSDFLLHDMGSLGDGIVQGAASGSEMRTAPLWGLRAITRYLHDSRATTLDAAILAHAGQGQAARDKFAALDAGSRAKLLAFLNSL